MRVMITKRKILSILEAFQILESAMTRDCKPGILELRKEKSRDAARSRRGKENYEFYELAKLLPLPAAITSQLDKASIIRLTISYLKLRDFSSQGDPQWTQDGGPVHSKINKAHSSRLDIADPFESRQGTHILQSLDGFAFILANDGRFLYISETVSIYLGLSQVEMAGSSIFEYVHPQDHTELAEHLGMCVVSVGPSGSPAGSGSEDGSSPTTARPSSPSEKGYMMVPGSDKNIHKSFSLRMKSTLTKRGVHVKTSGYRVVHILGTVRPQTAYGQSRAGAPNPLNKTSTDPPLLGLVGMAIALPPPTITELRLELDTFITRLSPDFKVIYCEPIISDLMDLSVDDVTDRLLYDLCHAADLKSLKRSHEDILNKGQALTDYYRLINKHGGFVWVQTCATTLLNNKNSDDQSILAINYVVSGVESKSSAVDLWQVTGDVNSAQSSCSNSRSREEKLKELKLNPTLPSDAGGKLKRNLSPSAAPHSPTTAPKADRTNVIRTAALRSSTTETKPADVASDDVDDVISEKSTSVLDSKNKRRKMDNPRKRKRSNSDCAEPSDKALNLTRTGGVKPAITDTSSNVMTSGQLTDGSLTERRGPGVSTFSLHPDHVTSSSPEDLSMKRTSSDRNIIQHSSSLFPGVASPTSLFPGPTSPNSLKKPMLDKDPTSIAGSSVQELEAAMNRHLPALTTVADTSLPADGHSLTNPLTTSSAKSFAGSGISSSVAPTPSWGQKPPGADMLTASNFLRSLYANRESVIKTSSRAQTQFLNPDPPTSLLTPPEPDPSTYKDSTNTYPYAKSDPFNYDKSSGFESREQLYRDQVHKEQFSFLPYKDHIQSAYIDHISSTYKEHLSSPYRDIIPTFNIPSLMSPSGRMHQAYSTLPHHFPVPITTATMDACSMTPPSSNSPDVSKQQPAYDTSGYSHDTTHTCSLTQKQMSSQPASHYHSSRSSKDQLYHAVNGADLGRGGYYGMTTPGVSSMYMDLNQTTPVTGQYESCTRPVLPWY
ncbi:neuronal PAS domain-containing protein 3-like isoform X2 [Physella acuta]|uniref:neuronal PAS domain-containing protein 3-like isoform X2 n=1 Tax=Physella acuta TaxID=109671 RepID=UPI0027DD79F1|nr:neuronal PAS domain-containing protein 3-like isoform X2 [Physella acuta]